MIAAEARTIAKPSIFKRIGEQRLPWIPLVIVVGLVLVALFGDLINDQIIHHDPAEPVLRARLRPPFWVDGGSLEYILGTDKLGRDNLARLISGARVTLIVGVAVTIIGGAAGTALGLFSGYFGGKVDAVIMRATDATLSLPSILIALLMAASLGPGYTTVIIAISLTLWARFSRVIRAQTVSIKEQDFIAQARVCGCSSARIITRHVFPNVFSTMLVLIALNLGSVILMEASLSFLGAGIPPPLASWGQMVADGKEYIATAWWVALVPGAAIAIVIAGFNLTGDWLRDRLDPRLRQV